MIHKEAWFRLAAPKALTPSEVEREERKDFDDDLKDLQNATGIDPTGLSLLEDLSRNVEDAHSAIALYAEDYPALESLRRLMAAMDNLNVSISDLRGSFSSALHSRLSSRYNLQKVLLRVRRIVVEVEQGVGGMDGSQEIRSGVDLVQRRCGAVREALYQAFKETTAIRRTEMA